jgi:hypothetical protein
MSSPSTSFLEELDQAAAKLDSELEAFSVFPREDKDAHCSFIFDDGDDDDLSDELASLEYSKLALQQELNESALSFEEFDFTPRKLPKQPVVEVDETIEMYSQAPFSLATEMEIQISPIKVHTEDEEKSDLGDMENESSFSTVGLLEKTEELLEKLNKETQIRIPSFTATTGVTAKKKHKWFASTKKKLFSTSKKKRAKHAANAVNTSTTGSNLFKLETVAEEADASPRSFYADDSNSEISDGDENIIPSQKKQKQDVLLSPQMCQSLGAAATSLDSSFGKAGHGNEERQTQPYHLYQTAITPKRQNLKKSGEIESETYSKNALMLLKHKERIAIQQMMKMLSSLEQKNVHLENKEQKLLKCLKNAWNDRQSLVQRHKHQIHCLELKEQNYQDDLHLLKQENELLLIQTNAWKEISRQSNHQAAKFKYKHDELQYQQESMGEEDDTYEDSLLKHQEELNQIRQECQKQLVALEQEKRNLETDMQSHLQDLESQVEKTKIALQLEQEETRSSKQVYHEKMEYYITKNIELKQKLKKDQEVHERNIYNVEKQLISQQHNFKSQLEIVQTHLLEKDSAYQHLQAQNKKLTSEMALQEHRLRLHGEKSLQKESSLEALVLCLEQETSILSNKMKETQLELQCAQENVLSCQDQHSSTKSKLEQEIAMKNDLESKKKAQEAQIVQQAIQLYVVNNSLSNLRTKYEEQQAVVEMQSEKLVVADGSLCDLLRKYEEQKSTAEDRAEKLVISEKSLLNQRTLCEQLSEKHTAMERSLSDLHDKYDHQHALTGQQLEKLTITGTALNDLQGKYDAQQSRFKQQSEKLIITERALSDLQVMHKAFDEPKSRHLEQETILLENTGEGVHNLKYDCSEERSASESLTFELNMAESRDLRDQVEKLIIALKCSPSPSSLSPTSSLIYQKSPVEQKIRDQVSRLRKSMTPKNISPSTRDDGTIFFPDSPSHTRTSKISPMMVKYPLSISSSGKKQQRKKDKTGIPSLRPKNSSLKPEGSSNVFEKENNGFFVRKRQPPVGLATGRTGLGIR